MVWVKQVQVKYRSFDTAITFNANSNISYLLTVILIFYLLHIDKQHVLKCL